jgi:hypothetical protein
MQGVAKSRSMQGVANNSVHAMMDIRAEAYDKRELFWIKKCQTCVYCKLSSLELVI